MERLERDVRRELARFDGLPPAQLQRIVEIWAEAALNLRDKDLRVMERLVAAQDRLLNIPAVAAE